MRLRRYLKQTRLFIEQALYESGQAMSELREAPLRASEFTTLEERILMSASPAAVVSDVPEVISGESLNDAQLLDIIADSALPPTIDTSASAPLSAGYLDAAADKVTELVFVDADVSNIDQIVNDLQNQNEQNDARTLEVVLLNSEKDGIAQITTALFHHDDVNGIHIISHGTEGQVQLGATTLSLDNIDTYRSALNGWQHSLSDTADVLFYGCDLASTDAGQELMQQIGAACDCDVAASEDLTGHETLGGDWDLEFESGIIESNIVFSSEFQQTWYSTLDIASGLAGHWTFDIDATDSSGNEYDGSISGGVIDLTDNTDIVGQAKLSLDGSNDHVDLDPHVAPISGLTVGTLAAWVNTSDSGIQTIFDVANDSGEWATLALNNGSLNWIVRSGGSDLVEATSIATINDGNWHHVVVTTAAGGNSIYIDGVQLTGTAVDYDSGTSFSSDFFSKVSSASSVTIGAYYSGVYGNHFDGLIDDVRIYDRALSTGDIGELYATGVRTPYVVTNTNDMGAGSLRWAIEQANANSGADTIEFEIPDALASGAHSIFLTTALPTITDTVTIDGTTDADWAIGSPVISVNGSLVGATDGLVLGAGSDGSTIRGLSVHSFTGAGIGLQNSGGHTIAGNHIGTGTSGTDHWGNTTYGIEIQDSGSNQIGGATATDRNVIVDNSQGGITIWGTGSTLNTIRGNYIGVDASGNAAIGNDDDGITIGGGASSNTIGGDRTAGEGNVISGQKGATSDGIEIYGDGTDNNKVYGNYIGTNYDGTAMLGNTRTGVVLYDGVEGTQIGGTGTGQGNIISANSSRGITIDGNSNSGTTLNAIIGNFIGTDVTGTMDFGNATDGVVIINGAVNTTVGGTTAAHRNVISGNNNDGIWITGSGTSNNIVQGNWIGFASDGDSLGNLFHGIGIENGASDNLIGGSDSGAGNRIGNSGWDGVTVAFGNLAGNSIVSNTITASGDAGIDLGDDGVTTNDTNDIDSGANGLDNYPLITKGALDGTSLTVSGTLDSATVSTQYRIEFFGVAVGDADPNNGEADQLLGTTNITTDGSGDGTFTDVVLSGVTYSIGDYITATATRIDNLSMVGVDDRVAFGDTSELSVNYAITANSTAVTMVPSSVLTNEDEALTFSTGNGNAIVVDSGSAYNPVVSMTLSVSDGSLTLATTTGIDFLDGTSDGDASITISGTESDINTALDGLQYLGDLDYNGSDTLAITTGSTATTEVNIYARYEFVAGSSNDVSGNARHGAASGNPTLTVDSERGDVLTFDGDDTVSIANGTTGLGEEVTIAAWINLDAGQDNNVFLSIGDAFYVTLDPSTPTYGMGVSANTFTTNTLTTDHRIAGTGWRHVAATVNDTTNELNLYLDGVLIKNRVYDFGDIDWPTEPSPHITLGAMSDGSRAFVGSLDDVRVYDSELSESEIVAIMGDHGYANDNASITVAAVNDSPTGNGAFLAAITEDTADPPGETIGTLFGGSFNDVDSGSSMPGVAITSNNAPVVEGVWQYSTDSGSNWYSIGTVDAANSLALSVSTHVRFLPAADFTGSPTIISLRALDNTHTDGFSSGATRATTDTGSPGGSSAISSSLVSLTHSVTSVNDAPIADLNGSNGGGIDYSTAFTEGGGAVYAIDTDATISDVDHSQYQSLGVSLAGFVDGAGEQILVASFQFNYGVALTTTTTVGSTPFELAFDGTTLTVTRDGGGLMPQADLQSLMRTVRYNNSSLTATSGNRTLSITPQDASGLNATPAVSTVSVTPASSTPAVTVSVPGTLVVNEDSSITFAASNSNAIVIDDGTASTDTRIQVSLSVADGQLKLSQLTGLTFASGVDDSTFMVIHGTEANINAALEGMTFTPTADFNGNPNLQVTASLDADLAALYSFEGGNANNVSYGTGADGAFIGDATTIIDGSRGEVLSLDGSGDRVEINDIYGSPTSITVGGWVNLSSTGRSELISLDNSVVISLDATGLDGDGLAGSTRKSSFGWNELESGQYISSTGWRHVMYTYDDALNSHRLYIDGVEVESGANNDSIRYTGASTTYIGAHPSNSGWDVGGLVDDIRVYSRALSADEIAALAADTHSATGNVLITVTAVNDAPVLTTQLGGGTRHEHDTFGTYVDTAATITDVDNLDFASGILTATISNNAESGDKLQLIDGFGVVVAGTNITYDDGGGAVTVASFTGGTDHTTPLVITFNTNANEAAVQAVARQIVFLATGDDPTSAQRTVTMQITDGDTGSSTPATRILNVVPVNDAPVASTTALSPTFTENSAAVSLFGSSAVDVVESADAVESIRITVDGLVAGSDDVLVLDGQAIELTNLNSETTATNGYTVDVTILGNTATISVTKPGSFSSLEAASLIDTLSYDNTSDALTVGIRSVTWAEIVDDGGGGDSTIVNTTSTVTISPVNDAPVVDLNGTNGGGVDFFNTFIEGGIPVDVTDLDAVISDVDDTTYRSLSINLNAFVDGSDEHIHIDGHKFDYGISLTRNTTVGSTDFEIDFDGFGFNITQNFGGTIPGEDLQALLRTVRYVHTATTPTISHRTIDIFAQDDEGLNSATAISTIAVSGTGNSRPTLTAFSSPVENTTEDTEVEVSFNDLSFHGNQTDADGTVVAFVVKSVPSGTLRIGANSGTATAYAAGANDTIDGSNHAYWTPPANVSGTLTAFTVVAEDDLGLESIGNIGAQIWVGPQNDAPAGLPVITGTLTEDQTLTANTAGITDIDGLGSFSYQWLRNGGVISGATAGTYTLVDADVGTLISVEVRYTDGDGTNEGPITSAQILPVNNVNDLPTGIVTIDNMAPNQGHTLSATNSLSDADGLSAVISYQWQRNGVDISGATSNTYTTVAADVGTVIRVTASYTDDQGTPESVTSVATAAVTNTNSTPTGSVTISGVPTEDQVLTAANTLADADGMGVLTYQWQRSGSDITGATGITYTLTDSDVGAMITVVARYTDGAGNPESVSSFGIGPVVNANQEESLTINAGLTVSEGSTGSIVSNKDLLTNDIDNTPTQLMYTLTTETVNGTLRFSGVPLTIGSTFSQANVNSGTITYDHFGTETSIDGFDFTVDDGAGSVTSGRFVITITAINDNDPIITSLGGGATGIVVAAENTTAVTTITATDADLPSQTLTYRIIGGADAAQMSIDTVSGGISFLTAPDFESPADTNGDNRYEVMVEVSDGGGRTDTQTVQVRITDIDEFDVSASVDSDATTNAVHENVAAGTAVGISALSTDADATANTITYSLDNDAGGLFIIDSGNGRVTTTASLDRESTGDNVNIVVRATSADGSSTTRGFNITVNDANDNAPVIPAAQTLTVAENVASGTSVGFIAASDIDTTGSLQNWAINAGNPDGIFALNAVTGELRIADPTHLDFETQTVHMLVITVDDGVNVAAPQSIHVLVADQNETPTATDDAFSVEQFSTLSTAANALTVNDADVDGDSLTAILMAGPQDGTIVLNPDGSFVYTPTGAFSGSDEFTYFATDGMLDSAAATVRITVTPVSIAAPVAPATPSLSDTFDSHSDNSLEDTETEDSDTSTELSENSDTETNTVLAALGQQKSGSNADAEILDGFHGDSVSQEILRRTSSEMFIAIFLDEIPESKDAIDEQRIARRSESSEREESQRVHRYLFEQVYATHPLLSGRRLNLNQESIATTPDARAFHEFMLEKVVVGSTAAVSTSVSVGYAVWLLRGGSLLTTFLSALPVWQSFDPLPVLDSFDQKDETQSEDESLLTMVSGSGH